MKKEKTVDKPENNDSEELDKELEQKLEEDIDTEVAEEIDLDWVYVVEEVLENEYLLVVVAAGAVKVTVVPLK